MLEVKSNRYDEIDKNRGYASLWSESEVRNAERGVGSDSDLSHRRRSSADDRLFDESSERNASGDNERIRQTVETEAGIDEIVNNLRLKVIASIKENINDTKGDINAAERQGIPSKIGGILEVYTSTDFGRFDD